MKKLLYKLLYNGDLEQADFDLLMRSIMADKVKDIHLAGFFGVMADRPLSGADIAGFATALNRYTTAIPCEAVDICGTGGSGHNTLNISTAAALLAASAGVPISKHGGRSVSGTGSADVLEALGVNIEMSPDIVMKARKETNMTFLYAPKYNTVLAKTQKFRKAYGLPTMFNLCAPLVNPSLAIGHVIGLSECSYHPEYSHAARKCDLNTTVLVSGADGLDEATTTSNTHVTIARKRKIPEKFIIRAHEIEMEPASLYAIKGGNAKHNADAIRHLFSASERGPYRDIVLLNAALAHRAAERRPNSSLTDIIEFLTPVLDKGRALRTLDDFVLASRG